VNTLEVEGVIAGRKDDEEEAVDAVEGGWEYAGILAVCDMATEVLVGNTGVDCAAIGRGGCDRGKMVLGGLNEGEGKGDLDGDEGDREDMLGRYLNENEGRALPWGKDGEERAGTQSPVTF
jgi:hypothetical protein